MAHEQSESEIPEGYEVGDWDFDPESDPAWDDPTIPRRRVPISEYKELADAVVRGASFAYCVIEDLRALVNAVQEHPDALLARLGEEDEEGIARTAGVFDKNGNKVETDATNLELHGCLIEHAMLSDLDIGCTLECGSRFRGKALFSNSNFSGHAWFGDTCFGGEASFNGTSFGSEAYFGDARFDSKVSFMGACFGDEASFWDTRFGGEAPFSGSRFGGEAWFGDALFDGKASFGNARFDGEASFGDAQFNGVVSFSRSHFHGETSFWNACFMKSVFFTNSLFIQHINFDNAHIIKSVRIDGLSLEHGCSFGSNESSGTLLPAQNDYRGDLRRADVRWVKLQRPDPPKRNAMKKLFRRYISKNIQSVNWTLVRAIGELSILARVSFLALIFVPMLASAWPAARVGITGYNDAVTDLSGRLEQGAEALRETSGELEGGIGESLINEVDEVERSVQDWSKRFGRMTVDDQDLPLTMALAFFAAAFVTIGQLVYQSRVPATIKKYDEEAFIEWMHGRYHDEAKDRLDGLRRACEYLKVIADQKPERNANFVKHHNDMIWIPPKDKIEWFEDITLTSRAPSPEGYVPGAERIRIALEEGAKAEYWYHAQKSKGWARTCFFAYLLGIVFLGWILVMQGINVSKAAGMF